MTENDGCFGEDRELNGEKPVEKDNLLSTVLSSLKVMQRMERLATNVYKNQVRGFDGNEIALKLQKAYEKEKQHAETLAGE